MVLSLDVDEILVRVGMMGEQFLEVNRLRFQVDLSGEEADGFSHAANWIHVS